MKRLLLFAVVWMLLATTAGAQVVAPPSLMNFQGRLARPDGTPVADGNYAIQFSLYNALTGGTLWWQRTVANVPVKNGTFAARLDFTGGYQNSATLASVFGASGVFLEIKIGTDAPLTPRQQFVTVAYAMKANSVPDGSITTGSILDGTIIAADLANGTITGAKIANGTITADKFAANIFNPLAWLLSGNSGTNPASQFLGTTDNQPLVFKVNNRQAMRYQYVENTAQSGFEYRGINILGGSDINSIRAGVIGATLAGGGVDNFSIIDFPNRVTDEFGTVGGGGGNEAGNNNTDLIDARFAAVAGGVNNSAGGFAATVPGGSSNVAGANYSFAAGQRAKANHLGAFVWADASDLSTDFASTAINQFLIRAGGGVGINKNNPAAALDIAGSAFMTGFRLSASPGNGRVLLSDASGNGSWGQVGSAGLADNAVTAAKIADNAITTAKLLDGTVGSADLASDASSLSKVSGGALSLNSGSLFIPNGVIQQGGSAVLGTADLGLYSQIGGQWMRFVTNGAPFRWYTDGGAGTTPIMSLLNNGRLSIGVNDGDASHRLTVGGENNALRLIGTGDFGSGAKLNFGDEDRVLLHEDVDDHLRIYTDGGTTIEGGSVIINTTTEINAPTEINAGGGDSLRLRSADRNPWTLRIKNDVAPTEVGIYAEDNGHLVITNDIATFPAGAELQDNGAWGIYSDRRIKTDIQPLTGLLEKTLALRPVSYYLNGQDRARNPHREVGFIAQEVEELFPSLVSQGSRYKSLNYAGLSVAAVGAVQELNTKLEVQQKQIQSDREEIAELKARNAELEARLERLEAALRSQK